MTEQHTNLKFHERLQFLGKKTAEFFIKMHAAWASGQGDELLKVVASVPSTGEVSAQAVAANELVSATPTLDSVAVASEMSLPEPQLEAAPVAMTAPAAETPAAEMQTNLENRGRAKITAFLAQLRQSVAANRSPLQLQTAPMTA